MDRNGTTSQCLHQMDLSKCWLPVDHVDADMQISFTREAFYCHQNFFWFGVVLKACCQTVWDGWWPWLACYNGRSQSFVKWAPVSLSWKTWADLLILIGTFLLLAHSGKTVSSPMHQTLSRWEHVQKPQRFKSSCLWWKISHYETNGLWSYTDRTE